MNTTDKQPSKSADLTQLDTLTGGVFTAPTSGERAARLRDWLASQPTHEAMQEVFRELSVRDKGAAKVLKEKLDEIKRAKAQDAIAAEWAGKAEALLAQPRLNMADAMAWQRDAAKAGAPLSREPLQGLKQALTERMKAVEELQHRVQVEREAAVLLAQRIEVLSTKPWAEAQAAQEGLGVDVQAWQQQAGQLATDPAWDSLDPKFVTQLDTSRSQLQLVWDAFSAALQQAAVAAQDPQAPLPAVPVWADELRVQRGEVLPTPVAVVSAEQLARQTQAEQAVSAALEVVSKEVQAGHSKAMTKAVADLRKTLKDHGRYIGTELDARVQSVLKQAGDLEDWQRWRADQLREELLGKAQALTQAPDGQRLSGRKMQETLRQLREQWKSTDQGGVPNHTLWKKFDDACNQAYKVVEAWLGKLKEQNEAGKAQRVALIDELQGWTQAHADNTDWKTQLRDLHAFAERWRQCGHLSEKTFAEVQPLWKAAMQQAHTRLEAAQAQSLARRQALIAEAQQLGEAPVLHIDAVKALQQRWQQEAHSVPLERRQEQKLWEAFRKPIDAAFERKSAEREKATAAVSAHDKVVLEAAKALEAANASGDAQQIRQAMDALQQALRSPASEPVPAVEPEAVPVEPAPADAAVSAAPRKLVAMRGDDRPGQTKAVPAVATRAGGRDPKAADRRGEPRAGRPDRAERAASGPRLGDAAFRAQRQALEHAELALKKLASQAHGEALVQLMSAWEKRDAQSVPAAQSLGGRAAAGARPQWVQALQKPAQAANQAEQSLLRLEMAAEVPTPAEHLNARRLLQLQLLTQRHAAAPVQTWVADVAQVLAAAHDVAAARRLQAVLKVMLKR